jgi:hypothetical protein
MSSPPYMALVTSLQKKKTFTPSHQIFRYMHKTLNIDKKKLIAQFAWKQRDESFKPN